MLVGILRIAWQAEQDSGGSYASQAEDQLARMVAVGGGDSQFLVAKTLTGGLYLREGDLGKAEEMLEQAWRWAKSKQALQNMCGIAMHLWALHHKKGDARHEAKYLKFFGETTAKKGYAYFREMSFASLVRTCARCVENNIAPKHMATIIGKYFGYDAVGFLLKEPSVIVADPDDFIRRFPTVTGSEPGSVRIKLFGAFELMADGNKIDSEMFKTRKVSGILKCILASPGKIVSREKLVATFWPDSDVKAAQNSLRVALYELRKTFSALNMPFDSRKALIMEDGDGILVDLYGKAGRTRQADSLKRKFTQNFEKEMGVKPEI